MQYSFEKLIRLLRQFQVPVPEGASHEEMERRLREAMRQHRERLRRLALVGAKNGTDRAGRNRYARAKTRKHFGIAYGQKPRLAKELLTWRFRSSPLMDSLVPDREAKWIPPLRRDLSKFPALSLKNFSLVDNPADTLRMLREIVETEATACRALLHFEDDYCIDIGAYLALGEMWPAMASIYEGGKMKAPVQKALKAVGLGQHLGIRLGGAKNTNGIWAYTLQRRRPRNTSASPSMLLEPQRREKVADGLCEAINKWLDLPEIERELSVAGRVWITSIVGELLDNAERHSAPETKDGDWATCAFMAARREGTETFYRCYIAFLSVGATISESLATASPQMQQYLEQTVERQMRRGQAPSVETLRTLFAFQDGVTRDQAAEEGRRGGLGLQEVLHFVNLLGGTTKPGCEPRITVISGQACIQLRNPYINGKRMKPNGGRELWCNPQNSHLLPPDMNFVYDLPERFGGTIISIAFTLDPEYLNGAVESENRDDKDR